MILILISLYVRNIKCLFSRIFGFPLKTKVLICSFWTPQNQQARICSLYLPLYELLYQNLKQLSAQPQMSSLGLGLNVSSFALSHSDMLFCYYWWNLPWNTITVQYRGYHYFQFYATFFVIIFKSKSDFFKGRETMMPQIYDAQSWQPKFFLFLGWGFHIGIMATSDELH